MTRWIVYHLAVISMVVILAACSSLQLPWSKASTSQDQSNQQPDFSNQPVESKLAMGTLKLEGTQNAVTTEQAKNLLPLWKAVKNISASTTASTEEITALYQQIQETMTPEQVQAIKDLQVSPEDMQALMKQYNLQLPQGRPAIQGTPGAQSGNRSGSNSNSGGGFPGGGVPPDGGGFPGGGLPPDAAGGLPGGGNTGGTSGRSSVQGTPQAGQPRGMRGGGLNLVFVDPLITLLQERAGN